MDDADLDKKVVGSVKEAIGKLTGNASIQAEGKAEKAAAEQAANEKPEDR